MDEAAIRARRAQKWLKTESDYEEERKEKEAKLKKEQEKAEREKKKAEKREAGGKAEKPAADGSGTKKAGGKEDVENMSEDQLMKRVDETSKERGRKGFDRAKCLAKLDEYLEVAKKFGPGPQLYILTIQASVEMDTAGGAFNAMKMENWVAGINRVKPMLTLLKEWYPTAEGANEVYDAERDEPVNTAAAAAGGDKGKEEEDKAAIVNFPRIQDLFLFRIEQLDDEMYKALQFSGDVYSDEYQGILANGAKLLNIIILAVKYLEEVDRKVDLARMAVRLMEQIYYKHDSLNASVFEAARHQATEEEKVDWEWPEDSVGYMTKLCDYVQQGTNDQSKTRALLCQAYLEKSRRYCCSLSNANDVQPTRCRHMYR